MIGEEIRIQFMERTSASCLRVGIDAPKNIPILRDKPFEKDLLGETKNNHQKK